jgi:hypothetical protein
MRLTWTIAIGAFAATVVHAHAPDVGGMETEGLGARG